MPTLTDDESEDDGVLSTGTGYSHAAQPKEAIRGPAVVGTWRGSGADYDSSSESSGSRPSTKKAAAAAPGRASQILRSILDSDDSEDAAEILNNISPASSSAASSSRHLQASGAHAGQVVKVEVDSDHEAAQERQRRRSVETELARRRHSRQVAEEMAVRKRIASDQKREDAAQKERRRREEKASEERRDETRRQEEEQNRRQDESVEEERRQQAQRDAERSEERRREEELRKQNAAEEQKLREEREEQERRRREIEAAERRRRELEEEELRRREEAARELVANEETVWAALSSHEADRMRSMLQGVVLFRQQMQQMDRSIVDLEETSAAKERACAPLRRRSERAIQEAESAHESHKRNMEELVRWDRKRQHCEEASEGVELLRTSFNALQAEIDRLREQAEPLIEERRSLRGRLTLSEDAGRGQGHKLVNLRSQCQQSITSLKAEQVGELANLRAWQTEELARLEVEWKNQVADIKSHHLNEMTNLRRAIEDTTRRRERLRQERDESRDMLLARQREGNRTAKQLLESKQEASELLAQFRSGSSPKRSTGASLLPAGPESTFQAARKMETELMDLRQKCKVLEQNCARMHSALERGQTVCERWRRRSLLGSKGGQRSGSLDVSGATWCHGQTSGRIFALGPSEDQPWTPAWSPVSTPAKPAPVPPRPVVTQGPTSATSSPVRSRPSSP